MRFEEFWHSVGGNQVQDEFWFLKPELSTAPARPQTEHVCQDGVKHLRAEITGNSEFFAPESAKRDKIAADEILITIF